MTPAIDLLKKCQANFTLHEYQHEASANSYGLEAAHKLGVNPEKVFKTLVAQAADGSLVVGLVPVSASLDLKALARAAGSKKVAMAKPADVQRATGYVMGGVSPLGQKKRLLTYIDSSAQKHDTIYISAGMRGLEIELPPEDLRQLSEAAFVSLIRG